MIEALKVGPIDVGQFVFGVAFVVLFVGGFCAILFAGLRAIEREHERNKKALAHDESPKPPLVPHR